MVLILKRQPAFRRWVFTSQPAQGLFIPCLETREIVLTRVPLSLKTKVYAYSMAEEGAPNSLSRLWIGTDLGVFPPGISHFSAGCPILSLWSRSVLVIWAGMMAGATVAHSEPPWHPDHAPGPAGCHGVCILSPDPGFIPQHFLLLVTTRICIFSVYSAGLSYCSSRTLLN